MLVICGQRVPLERNQPTAFTCLDFKSFEIFRSFGSVFEYGDQTAHDSSRQTKHQRRMGSGITNYHWFSQDF